MVAEPRPEENHDFEPAARRMFAGAHTEPCGASSSASAVEAAVAATAGRSSGGAGAATAAEVGGGRIIELSTKTRHKSFAAVRLHSLSVGLHRPYRAASKRLQATASRHRSAAKARPHLRPTRGGAPRVSGCCASRQRLFHLPPYTLAESRLQEGESSGRRALSRLR